MKTLDEVDVKNKRVLVRTDLNVAIDERMENKGILKEAAKTINYLKANGAKIILMSELGEPVNGVKTHFRIEKIADNLEKELHTHIVDVDNITVDSALEAISNIIPGEIVLLENLGFYKEEYLNDDNFALQLSRLADIYVDDDFRISNKKYSSNVAITKHLPSYAGLSLRDELDKMTNFINTVESPFVMLIGGTDPEKKMPVIERFLPVADTVLVAGEIALAFLKAQGHSIGGYTLSDTALAMAGDILEQAKKEKCEILCPVDFLAARQIVSGSEHKEVSAHKLPDDWFVVDIGPKTFKEFNKKIYDARTVLWNGTVGVYEIPDFEYGTRAMAQAIASTAAKTIVGGDDTVYVINKYGKSGYIDIISYGGDSFLSYLKAEELPGVTALG